MFGLFKVANLETIDSPQVAELLRKKGLKVLDVRTNGEWKMGNIAGSVNIDITGSDFADKIGKLNKATPYLIYCRSGVKSMSAARYMSKLGFEEMYNLKGGFMAYSGKQY
ncbi:MAG: rhodanese-like domain-containing protein [Psychrilyobacter sp.]|nr:rhodanese-like domain-containing protein [Psychrilyobacter sp.]